MFYSIKRTSLTCGLLNFINSGCLQAHLHKRCGSGICAGDAISTENFLSFQIARHVSIEIGLEHAHYVVLVYYFTSFELAKTC
jgi:hypothetical protein